MNIRTCRKCGRMFNYITGIPVCPACREVIEAKFQEVKEYIRANKGAGIQEVAEACSVETSQITQWLREDRLELSSDSNIMINCERCGAPIRSGKFCDACRNSMTNSLNRMAGDIRADGAAAAAAAAKRSSSSGFRSGR